MNNFISLIADSPAQFSIDAENLNNTINPMMVSNALKVLTGMNPNRLASVSSNLKIGVGKVYKARQRSALEFLRTPILSLDKALVNNGIYLKNIPGIIHT